MTGDGLAHQIVADGCRPLRDLIGVHLAGGVVRAQRDAIDTGQVGNALRLEESATVPEIRIDDVARLIGDEGPEAFTPREVLAHHDRHGRRLHEPVPALVVVDHQRVFEEERLHGLQDPGELDRRGEVELPVAMAHDVVLPANRLADVFEGLADAAGAPSSSR